jgi:hypothetical protein
MCVHRLLYAIGLLLVDHCDLSNAASFARRTGRCTGALAVSPIGIPRGTGCLVTPVLVV